MKHVLGIDPGGKTTGVVLLAVPEDEPAYLVDSWGIDGTVEALLEWWDNSLPHLEDVTIVCEQFVNRGVHGADLSPLRIEGAVELLCLQNGEHLVWQPAAGKDTSVPDAALKRLGITKKSFGGDHHHDRFQAAKHAVWYLKRMRHRPTTEKAFPNV